MHNDYEFSRMGLLEKRFCRAYFDPERRIVAFTFFDVPEEGAIKVTTPDSTAYINIHSFLKLIRSAPVLWDETQKCAFVMLENSIAKKESG